MKGKDFFIRYLVILFTIVISIFIGDKLFDSYAFQMALVAASLLVVVVIMKLMKR